MFFKRNKIDELDEEDIPESVRKMKKNNKDVNIDEQKTKKFFRLKKFFKFILIFCILFLILKLGISTFKFVRLAQDMLSNENSIVLDTEGVCIASLGSDKKKKTISTEQIPDNLKNAYISIEDERFYSHHGIDFRRTSAAIVSYIIHFGKSSFGGSTITQQLIKNLTGDSDDSITRKVNEWWRAFWLETFTSKDKILTGYLNAIYVGPNVYGVEAGSEYYFNKSVDNLSLAECAFLAGITNSPNSYNPFSESTNNSEKIKKRTSLVLSKMKELGYISESDYSSAISELEAGLKFNKSTTLESDDGVYSYHTDALISELTKEFADKYKISEKFASNYFELAGATIYSTQDSSIQKEIETEFAKTKYSLASKNGGNSSQAAMVLIDHSTGRVLGCAGGLGKKTTSRPLNRATQSIRQTGSAMKPLAILVPAIDKKIITCASIYDDTEQDFDGGYHPTDYNKSLGNITVRRAVESSQNIPFVRIMQELKPSTSIKYMKKMGITTLTKGDESLALSLGGLEKGISPLEMAGGYSTIANDGVYIEPTFYTSVKRRNDKVLIKSKQKKKRVFSKEVAYVLKKLLQQPVDGSAGTATYCKISGVDVAAKTGTTDENYDRWLCGFTPYYTAVCWFGFDINESINFNNRNPAGLIWANVMSRVHAGLQSAQFEQPKNVISAKICSDSGMRATTSCSNTYVEYFLKGTVPNSCTLHSGTDLEYIQNNNTSTKETVKNITNEIDAPEPPRITNDTNSTVTNSSSEPSHTNTPTPSPSQNVTNSVENKVENTTKNDNVNNSSNTVSTDNIENTVSNSSGDYNEI